MKQQDIDDLKQLIEFLKAYQVTEFDLDRGDTKIRLKFSPSVAVAAPLVELAKAAVVPAAASAAAPAFAAAPAAPAEEAGLHIIKSPLVGTFYGSPSPDAAAFVSVGDRVTKGKVVGIVEAMKLMNEIESDITGQVVACLATNGQAIEYGQPLYSVRIG
ncbi:acetyl-CoA carboxylase biotin carboxyl carrier protein [Telmatobacter bradus]|uniref:acetyl-CoA carboxylase biotin carboxyl carrier protein n=1 Tax=Telmatobacter bradus TaxID=474953 RepID=UPI003B4321E2